jgi:hypothetical protein
MAPRTRSRSNNLSSQISKTIPASSDESDVEKTFDLFLNAIPNSTSNHSSSDETDVERTFDRLLMAIPSVQNKVQCSQISPAPSNHSSSDESHVQRSFNHIMKAIPPLSLNSGRPRLWASNRLSNLDEEPHSQSKDSLRDDEPEEEDVPSESDERHQHHSDESFRDTTPENQTPPSSSSPTPLSPVNKGPPIHHVISMPFVPIFLCDFIILSDSVFHGPAHHVGDCLSAPWYPRT